MSLTLILMRHAKSDWDDPGLDDFDRPLNRRGRRSAEAIGKWLSENGVLPDLALTSGAQRTVETWNRVEKTMQSGATMRKSKALYLSSAPVILKQIASQNAAVLMVICHNPGIANFAARIVSAQPDHSRYFAYPTAATAIIEFSQDDWRDVEWESGRLSDFVVPRDLF